MARSPVVVSGVVEQAPIVGLGGHADIQVVISAVGHWDCLIVVVHLNRATIQIGLIILRDAFLN